MIDNTFNQIVPLDKAFAVLANTTSRTGLYLYFDKGRDPGLPECVDAIHRAIQSGLAERLADIN